MKAGDYKLENEFEGGFGMGFDFIFLSAVDVWRPLIGFVLTALAYTRWSLMHPSTSRCKSSLSVYWLSDVCRCQ